MRDIFFFDNMLTPKIITIVYWLLLAAALLTGISRLFDGYFLMGLGTAIGGAIGARIWCELMIVLFKMNEALQALRNK